MPDDPCTTRTVTVGGEAAWPIAGEPAAGAERYEALGLLGRGGMGEVHRVRDRLLDCVVARKSLALDRSSDPAARARFVAEATVTARLRHPGIVAVHDRGESPDGVLWYTMTEVRGDTLAAKIRAERGTPDGLRRLVAVLVRVCEALAYAHQQGVVHRDLKPDNLMVGPFGEVLVMDWGIAAPVDHGPDEGAGTPGWVAPEQAAGCIPAPTADVYALGGILHALLTGGPPRTGPSAKLWFDVITDPPRVAPPGPEPLVALCVAAMEPDPTRRPPDAGAFGGVLTRWLLDAERTAEATALLTLAMQEVPAIAALRAEARDATGRARTLLAGLTAYAGAEAKAPAWAWEDRAGVAEREATVRETRWLQAVGAALERDPTLQAAHEALADHYAAELERAEADHRAQDALRAEEFLAHHDRGRHAALLLGDGAVELATEPPGATVQAFRFVERGRRLVPEPYGVLGTTPLREVRLPRGSWLLVLSAEGFAPARYPVAIDRGAHWDGGTVTLLRPDALGPDDCYVPAGWFWCGGGEPDAIEPLPRQRVWVDGLVMRRFPVTNAEFRAFVEASGGPGALDVGPLPNLDPARDQFPATDLTATAAEAFAAWEAARTGLPWRLPDEVEWEKAARGVDGRTWVTGNHFEPTWFNVLGGAATPRVLELVGQHPLDESVYGVRDLTGNAVDRCANGWRDGAAAPASGRFERVPVPGPLRTSRGGAFDGRLNATRTTSRMADPDHQRFTSLGFRLARSLVSSGPTSGRSDS